MARAAVASVNPFRRSFDSGHFLWMRGVPAFLWMEQRQAEEAALLWKPFPSWGGRDSPQRKKPGQGRAFCVRNEAINIWLRCRFQAWPGPCRGRAGGRPRQRPRLFLPRLLRHKSRQGAGRGCPGKAILQTYSPSIMAFGAPLRPEKRRAACPSARPWATAAKTFLSG